MMCGNMMQTGFSDRVGADPRHVASLNKRSRKGYFWVDGRLTQTQVTSRPDDLARSVVVAMGSFGRLESPILKHWHLELAFSWFGPLVEEL